MMVMAMLGAIWFALDLAGATGAAADFAIEIHKLLGNIAWAYLIGHGLMAVLHHFRGDAGLGEMWSLRPTDAQRDD